MPKSRLSVVVYLLLVFISGALVGGFSSRLMTAAPVKAPTRTPDEWRKHYINDMRGRVKMDDQQINQLVTILDDTKQQFDQVRQKYKPIRDEERAAIMAIQGQQIEKIRALLRPEQRAAYEQLREERERRRQQDQDKKEKERKH
jgi:Spy/CpxP family protein refolding chaperone